MALPCFYRPYFQTTFSVELLCQICFYFSYDACFLVLLFIDCVLVIQHFGATLLLLHVQLDLTCLD